MADAILVPVPMLQELLGVAEDACSTGATMAKQAIEWQVKHDALVASQVELRKVANSSKVDPVRAEAVLTKLATMGYIDDSSKRVLLKDWQSNPDNMLTFIEKFAWHVTQMPSEGEAVINVQAAKKAKDPDGWLTPDS